MFSKFSKQLITCLTMAGLLLSVFGIPVEASNSIKEIKGIRKVLIVPKGQTEEGIIMAKQLGVSEVAEGIPPRFKNEVSEDMLPYVYEEVVYKEKAASVEASDALEKLGADIAEYYPVLDENIGVGDLVSIINKNDLSTSTKYLVEKSGSPYDSRLLGVISSNAAVIINSGSADTESDTILRPVALVGQALVKVSLENGQVAAGDYLTSSSKPGVAMKATVQGKVIGMALEDFDESKITDKESETGQVMMFINVGWYPGQATSTDVILSGDLWGSFKNLVSAVVDAVTGLPKMIVNGILEVRNDVLTHGVFKTIVKVAKTVVDGRTILIDNAALAESSQLEVAGEDADSLSFITYSIISPRKEIMVSGSGKLLATTNSTSSAQTVEAKISFHPYFSSVISEATPIRVIVTPTSYINGQLYVAEKSIYGFTVKEINSQDANVEFDWIVTARLTDVEQAQEVLDNTENVASQENISSTTEAVCQLGENRPCGSEVGACLVGVQVCEQGVWGECIGAVFPATEICDGVDNNCDSVVDEGGVCAALEPEPITTSTEPIVEPQATTTEPVLNTTTTEPIIISSTTDSIITSSSTDSASATTTP